VPRVRTTQCPVSCASLFANGLELYESALASAPLATKCVTSAVGFAVADVVAQTLSGGFSDPKRFLGNSVFGLILYGPASSAWYGVLDQYVYPEIADSPIAVTAKTALDQLIWAPILITGLFAWDLQCKGENMSEELPGKLNRDLLNTLKVNWTFWPVFHLINFRFVSPADRILYINCVQVLYNVFLVLKAADRGEEGDGEVE